MNNPNAKQTGEGCGLSRRHFLGMLGAAGAAAYLVGCEESKKLSNLPDPPPLMEPEPHTILPARPIAPVVPAEAANTYGILPRSMWAKAGPDMNRVDAMNGVKLITFHHSGDPKVFATTDFNETAQHLEYVREYHRSRNFQDIGYHFAIDRAGRVWQLRSLKYQGQHVRSNNEHNVGVVVLGNFDLQGMSQAQKDKVKIFGKLLRTQYKLDASRLYTHQEIVSTECPGDAMQPFMVSIRKQRLI